MTDVLEIIVSESSVVEVEARPSQVVEVQSLVGAKGVSSWDDLKDKPAVFPPEAHGHAIGDTAGLQAALDGKASGAALVAHTGNQDNPHNVTKAQVGLGNADNTPDHAKPISTAQQAALDGKAPVDHTHLASAITDFAAAVLAYLETRGVGGVLSGNILNPVFSAPVVYDTELESAVESLLEALAEKAALVHAHDASAITSGTLAVERIPVLLSQLQIVSNGGIADLTPEQQGFLGQGTMVTTTDGKRWVYKGTGSKTDEASFILWADITPEWSVISGKPSSFPTTSAEIADSTASGRAFLTALTVAAQKALLAITIGDVAGLQTALDNQEAARVAQGSTLTQHMLRIDNPHGTTKAQVGLGNVDNTSDANKPVSIAQQAALDGKANTVHTHAISDTTGLQAALDGKANLSQIYAPNFFRDPLFTRVPQSFGSGTSPSYLEANSGLWWVTRGTGSGNTVTSVLASGGALPASIRSALQIVQPVGSDSFFSQMQVNRRGALFWSSEKTLYLTLYARVTAGSCSLTPTLRQFFGTGGGTLVDQASEEGPQALTADWTRYTFTFNMPTVAGKTVGGTDHAFQMYCFLGTGAKTVEIAGIMLTERAGADFSELRKDFAG